MRLVISPFVLLPVLSLVSYTIILLFSRILLDVSPLLYIFSCLGSSRRLSCDSSSCFSFPCFLCYFFPFSRILLNFSPLLLSFSCPYSSRCLPCDTSSSSPFYSFCSSSCLLIISEPLFSDSFWLSVL